MKEPFLLVQRPEEMGLSSLALKDFWQKHQGMGLHGLSVTREGQAFMMGVAPWSVEVPQAMFSLSKSVLSLAAGILIHEGKLRLNDRVVDVLEDELPERLGDGVSDIRLSHLLSMASGLDKKSDARALRKKTDWVKAVLAYPVLDVPGSRFFYHTLGSYLAGRMVARRAGENLRDYLMPRLFTPLGIQKPQWDCCPMGYNTGGFGLHLSLLDITKIAQLLLNQGVWQGAQLLPRDYLDQATKKQVESLNPSEPARFPELERGYGYQFWMSKGGRFRADGLYGQVMLMDPKEGIALCATAGLTQTQTQLDALHELMDELLTLPPAKQDEQQAFLTLASSLSYPPPPNDPAFPLPLEASYRDREGRFLRLEVPSPDTLRLFFKNRAQEEADCFTFGRKQAHIGEYRSFRIGEMPQPYQGLFGITADGIHLQALMPQAPYAFLMRLAPDAGGLLAELSGPGFVGGRFVMDRVGL